MNMTQLIETAQAQRERKEAERIAQGEERARAIEAGKAADLAALRELLGEAADEVEIARHSSKTDGNGEVYDTGYYICPKAWHGMARFSAEHWRSSAPWTFKYYRVSGACVRLKLPFPPGNVWARPEVIEMIAELQATYEKVRDSRIALAVELLSGDRSNLIAAEVFHTLMALAPEREAEWDAALAAWQQRRDARAAAVDAYVEKLAAWRAKYERTLAENRRVVAGVQRALDEEFTRYEVAYAAVGDDDDEPYRETAWADHPEPEESGYWAVYDNGDLVRRRLLRPLWVSEAITQTVSAAGEGPWRRAHYVHDAGVTVYYLPWGTVELHRQLDKIITPLPAEPEPPAFLRDGLTAAERERINEVTRGMGRVDIPF